MAPASGPWALLPVVLVAGMVGLGIVLEVLRFGDVLWVSKLPLVALLVLALRRR